MASWKMHPDTDNDLKPIIRDLSNLILDGTKKIKTLPDFDSIEDLGVDADNYENAREIIVRYKNINYHLLLFFYHDNNKDFLAVRNLENNRNLLQLSLEKFVAKTFNIFEIWHDGSIPRIDTATALKYYGKNEPDLILNDHGTLNILLGSFRDDEKISINNTNLLIFISKLLRFSISRNEIKKDKIGLKSNDKIQILIDKYIKKLEPGNKKEIYKWKLVKSNLGKPNLNAKDFGTEIKRLEFGNLIFHMAKPAMDIIARSNSEAYRDAFKGLVDEDIPLLQREHSYVQSIEKLYRPLAENPKSPHHHDGRTMAALLTYHNPEKYTFYMSGFYQSYCKYAGIEISKSGTRYPHYLQLIDDLVAEYIVNNEKLLALKNSFLTNDCYQDPNHLILAQDILYQNFKSWNISDTDEDDDETIETNDMDNKKQALNQILYGPPGTGKTYHTITKALEIIDGKSEENLLKMPREEVKNRFNELINCGRIVFSTFHQSMSYEDFIEGIKPLEPKEEDEFVKYDIQPGIFKSLCDSAKQITTYSTSVNWDKVDFYKMSLGGKNRPDIHEWCINNNLIALGYGGETDLSKYNKITSWPEYRDAFSKEFPELVAGSRYHIQALYIFQKMKINDIVVISKGNHIIDAIGIIKSDYYWDDNNEFDFFHFRKVEWIAKNINTSPERFFKKQVSQQTIYEFYKADVILEAFRQLTVTGEKETKPYVLIIDEINRGNVSQIFGELITLIEEDKRDGAKEAIELKLPYSKKPFSVPSNVYIIGTMNTADRSVEALDTALRRRFSFVEMPPKYDLPEMQNTIDGINLSELLQTINGRIAKLLDYDHQIGHSYFLNIDSVNDLKAVIYDKVIPLLQEYFYGDYGKIGLVLGEGFVEIKSSEDSLFAKFKAYDGSDFSDKKLFKILPHIGEENNDLFIAALHLTLGTE